MLLDHNLQVLLAIVSQGMSTEYTQLESIDMMNKLFHKQADLSPKNQNRYLGPILKYVHFNKKSCSF